MFYLSRGICTTWHYISLYFSQIYCYQYQEPCGKSQTFFKQGCVVRVETCTLTDFAVCQYAQLVAVLGSISKGTKFEYRMKSAYNACCLQNEGTISPAAVCCTHLSPPNLVIIRPVFIEVSSAQSVQNLTSHFPLWIHWMRFRCQKFALITKNKLVLSGYNNTSFVDSKW